MSRSTSQSSIVTSSAGGHSRTLSLKTSKPPQPANPIAASDATLFVTNLRLLDFDTCPDWPNIAAQTFSSKNADQKQRIGGVEWALFRLFEIWDPVETSQKLQPFFPAHVPLQSVNLRAALYRCLNDLKKNGVLGRETVLRKTMLDECKGEKFLQMLVAFSTAVLQKVVARQQPGVGQQSSAYKLSMATSLLPSEQASLLPLAIAHKSALTNLLRRKAEKRRRFIEFEGMLDDKAAVFTKRLQQCKATPRTQKAFLPEKEANALKRQLKDMWIGDQRWLDTMLHGDDVPTEDAFLAQHFDQVWPVVEQGGKLADFAPEVGLLEELESRVQDQQARLQKWRAFHDKLRANQTPSTKEQNPPQSKGYAFRFDDHLEMQLPKQESSDTETAKKPMHPDYHGIIADLDAELLRLAKVRHDKPASQLRRKSSSLSGSQSPQRRRKSRSDSNTKQPVQQPVRTATEKAARPLSTHKKSQEPVKPAVPSLPLPRHDPLPTPARLDSEATLVGAPSTIAHSTSPEPATVPPSTTIANPDDSAAASSPHTTADHSIPSPPSLPSSHWPSEPPHFSPPTQHPIQDSADHLAEDIISTLAAGTPSPVKKPQPRLSLLERTRLSMAPRQPIPTITESEISPQDSPSLPQLPPELEPAPLDRRASLLERTRLSMAAMSATSQNQSQVGKKKKEKRTSTARTSLFPVNQFDTPAHKRVSINILEEEDEQNEDELGLANGDGAGSATGAGTSKGSGKDKANLLTTPKEDLFSDDVDYETVFKSRPRVAHSPVFDAPPSAPSQTVEDEHDDSGDEDADVTGIDLGDVDAEDEDDGGDTGLDYAESPLKGRRGRAVFA